MNQNTELAGDLSPGTGADPSRRTSRWWVRRVLSIVLLTLLAFVIYDLLAAAFSQHMRDELFGLRHPVVARITHVSPPYSSSCGTQHTVSVRWLQNGRMRLGHYTSCGTDLPGAGALVKLMANDTDVLWTTYPNIYALQGYIAGGVALVLVLGSVARERRRSH